jgi:5-methylthioribose kinase
MDLGLFLAHLTLKTIRALERRQEFYDLIANFWRGYFSEVHFGQVAELERRGIQHLGVCLLARIDGTSPVDYLPEEDKREAIRRLGRSILLDGLGRWEEVRGQIEREVQRLSEG